MFICLLQVACMQFINIVVHSVEDMNFRVHLQYEFTKLGLDDYLEVTLNMLIIKQVTQVESICAVCSYFTNTDLLSLMSEMQTYRE